MSDIEANKDFERRKEKGITFELECETVDIWLSNLEHISAVLYNPRPDNDRNNLIFFPKLQTYWKDDATYLEDIFGSLESIRVLASKRKLVSEDPISNMILQEEREIQIKGV